jgi:hypothetical protein
VQDARHLVLQLMPDFPDLAALNAWLEQRCITLWERTPHGTLPRTIAEVWAVEKTALMPTPPAFDGFVRAEQAGVADLPDQLRAQPLQRSGLVRQGKKEGPGRSPRASRAPTS